MRVHMVGGMMMGFAIGESSNTYWPMWMLLILLLAGFCLGGYGMLIAWDIDMGRREIYKGLLYEHR
jgi:H+/Cl- antiporter ClcA